MNFDKSLRNVAVNAVAVPGVLLRTGRIYSCDICKTRTGWRFTRDGFETPCCSDECLDLMEERRLEVEKEELTVAARIDEHQNGTASDLADVRCQVMPMSDGSGAGKQSEPEDTSQTSAQADEAVQGGAETHQQTSTRAKRNPEAGLAPADRHVVLKAIAQ